MPNRQPRKIPLIKKADFLPALSIFLCFLGVLVRLVQYFNNRALWDDEAKVAFNLINRSYSELFDVLDYNQAAPPGFLLIEKSAIQILGDNEYAFRLLPFLAGITSIFLFYQLANKYASKTAVPIAIALFSCSLHLIHYTTEVKQYSSDVMVALGLCLVLLPQHGKMLTKKQIIAFAILGSISIFLSHPAVLILAGIELSHLLFTVAKRRYQTILNRLTIYLTWLIAFGLVYAFNIRVTMGNAALVQGWESRYPASWVDIVWLFDAFGKFFYHPLGFGSPFDGIAIFAFLVGCVAFYRQNRIVLITLLLPFGTTFFAAYLHAYPFKNRLVLFLTPFAILLIAEGIHCLLAQFKQDRYYQGLLGLLLLVSLALPPMNRTVRLIISPELKQEIRPVIAYIQTHREPHDAIYIYQSGQQSFRYYAGKYGLSENDYILGERKMFLSPSRISHEGLKAVDREIDPLRGKPRVWFIITKSWDIEEIIFVAYLNQRGKQLDKFQKTAATVYLYDLRETQ